jgi:hypothetical protein
VSVTRIAYSDAQTRSCGDCSLCCKLIHVVELNKPHDTWCMHCKPGRGGCSIYADRPPSCQGFQCGWLASKGVVGDEWRPTRSKMIIINEDGPGMRIVVDPAFPNAWRREPYHSQLLAAIRYGTPVMIRVGLRAIGLNADGTEHEGPIVGRNQTDAELR